MAMGKVEMRVCLVYPFIYHALYYEVSVFTVYSLQCFFPHIHEDKNIIETEKSNEIWTLEISLSLICLIKTGWIIDVQTLTTDEKEYSKGFMLEGSGLPITKFELQPSKRADDWWILNNTFRVSSGTCTRDINCSQMRQIAPIWTLESASQTIIHSTCQHSTTLWSVQQLLRKKLWEMRLLRRGQHRAFH